MVEGRLKRERGIAVYARYSSDKQRSTSIDDQVARCRDHVARLGGAVDESLIFTDFALSGSLSNRPGYLALRRAVTDGRVKWVIAEDQSRVARDNEESANLCKLLGYHGVPLLTVGDGIDTASKGGRLSYAIKSVISEVYLDDLRDKTLRGLKGRALAGHCTGGKTLGYGSEAAVTGVEESPGRRPVVLPAEAELVQRIFRMYLNGNSPAEIARTFNNENIAKPRIKSKCWRASGIREMLRNRKYIGEWSFNSKSWGQNPATGSHEARPNAPDEVVTFHAPHLRIVDRDLWDAVQTRIADRFALFACNEDGSRKGRKPGARVTKYPFSGLLVCSACQSPMVIAGGSSGRVYYRCGENHKGGTCSNKLAVREDVARVRLIEAIQVCISSDAGIAYARKKVVEALARRRGDSGKDLRALEQESERVERRIDSLIDAIADGDKSQRVRQRLQDDEVQADEIKAKIERLRVDANVPIRLPTVQEILDRVLSVTASVEHDPVASREALRALLKGGTIVLHATTDPAGKPTYEAHAELLPLGLLLQEQNAAPVSRDGGCSRAAVAGAGFEPTTFGL